MSDCNPPPDLDAIARLAKAATPGPWGYSPDAEGTEDDPCVWFEDKTLGRVAIVFRVASFRAGIDCIGGAQAKAGFDALLDLRDARQRIAALQSENAALREELDAAILERDMWRRECEEEE